MLRLLAIAAALACQGCFVLDELDAGEEIMDKMAGRGGPEESKPAPSGTGSSGDDGPGAIERAKGWVTKALEPEPPPPEPIVRCDLRDGVQFMRESDCALRGGRSETREAPTGEG